MPQHVPFHRILWQTNHTLVERLKYAKSSVLVPPNQMDDHLHNEKNR
jgi:hypothetical protein